MTIPEEKIEKIPSVTCKKCGSFRVMITDDGPECIECDTAKKTDKIGLSMEVEYLIYQLNSKENEQ